METQLTRCMNTYNAPYSLYYCWKCHDKTTLRKYHWHRSTREEGVGLLVTVQVVVLVALGVREGVELPEEQWVLQHPLDGLDQVRLEGEGVLLPGVTLIQEGLENGVRLSYIMPNTHTHTRN